MSRMRLGRACRRFRRPSSSGTPPRTSRVPRPVGGGWPSYIGPGMGPKYAVFRVYLRWPKQRVTDKTVTPQRYLAWMAYRALCSREDLVGQPVAAAITANGRQLAFHRFDDPSPIDPWNDPGNR
jgi:hypothetical protein